RSLVKLLRLVLELYRLLKIWTPRSNRNAPIDHYHSNPGFVVTRKQASRIPIDSQSLTNCVVKLRICARENLLKRPLVRFVRATRLEMELCVFTPDKACTHRDLGTRKARA